jgi:hypothetical protein
MRGRRSKAATSTAASASDSEGFSLEGPIPWFLLGTQQLDDRSMSFRFREHQLGVSNGIDGYDAT